MGLDARNQLGLTEKETLNMMASGKGYEENQQGRDAVQAKLDRLSGPASPDEPNLETASKGRWIGPGNPTDGGGSGWISENMRRAVEAHHAKLDNSPNPLDVLNKQVDGLSEQERFVRFGTTDRKVIVDNLMNLNKKVDKYVEARSMLDGMSEGQLQNRFASTDKQDILQRLGYDKNFLREINQYSSGSNQAAGNPASDARSVGNQALVDQMNNSNFARDAANIIKENPVLQKAILGEVVYRPGEQQQGGRVAAGKGGKSSPQMEALQVIQQLKAQHKGTRPGITDPEGDKLNAMQQMVVGAMVENATYTGRQELAAKDEMANREMERKLKLLKLLGGH